MTRPLYIFDLDGTLADNSHRAHILESNAPDKWDRFFLACGEDAPVRPVIRTFYLLALAGSDCWIWSGRGSIADSLTRQWLQDRVLIYPFGRSLHTMSAPQFRMRAIGDYTPDDQLKRQWLHELSEEDRERLVAVFDDRQKVVDMWRSEGVACFQVAPGDF